MKDLTQGGETKAIVAFALPMLIGNVFQQFYNMVDSIVVGNFVGTTALAAVGTAFPVIFLMISLVMGLTMGTTVLVAQYFGAKDRAKVRAAVDTGYITLFWAGLAMSIIGVATTDWILVALKVPADVFPEASAYLRIIFAGLLAMFGYNAISAILRGLGDSKTPLYLLMAASLLNVVLDLLFVVGFGWGVSGASWATVISQGASFVGGIVWVNTRNDLVRLSIRELRFDREIFKHSLRIGLPTGVQQTMVSLGMMALTRIVNGYGTDDHRRLLGRVEAGQLRVDARDEPEPGDFDLHRAEHGRGQDRAGQARPPVGRHHRRRHLGRGRRRRAPFRQSPHVHVHPRSRSDGDRRAIPGDRRRDLHPVLDDVHQQRRDARSGRRLHPDDKHHPGAVGHTHPLRPALLRPPGHGSRRHLVERTGRLADGRDLLHLVLPGRTVETQGRRQAASSGRD